MKFQQCRWFKRDRHSSKPIRFSPKRTESGDQPIQDEEIWGTLTRTIEDQQLMFDENGLRYDGVETAGAEQAAKRF
jgi:hypothetical protein